MPTKKKTSKAPVKSTSLLGGKATLKLYGRQFYVDMAKKRWAKHRRAQRAAKATAK